MGILQDEIAGDVGSVPRCASCGSERVVLEALACWNTGSGLWEVEKLLADARCIQCGGKCTLVWSRSDALRQNRIRELNDVFRNAR